MEETYNLNAIVLYRRPFAEVDGCVTLYSWERGKLDLVVRGLKKIKSKLAGHLEPLTLASIMAVRGRQYDYVGAAVSEQSCGGIKCDLEKLTAAGRAINVFNKLVKIGVVDEKLFILLKNFLQILNNYKPSAISYELFLQTFIFKLLSELGHQPELYYCVNCRSKITPVGMKFDPARGGLICGKCSAGLKEKEQLTISENSVKLLRLAEKNGLEKIVKIKIDKKAEVEIKNIISSFLNYIF